MKKYFYKTYDRTQKKTYSSILTLMLAGALLGGCSDSSSPAPGSDDDTDTGTDPVSYEVRVINATNNQPISPLAVITHSSSFSAWTIGSAASTELEYIAEGGSNSQLLASLSSDETSFVSGKGAIGPGGNETISITAISSEQTLITVIGMLVNTNDGFSGIRSVDVSDLSSGDSMIINAKAYDAGTEINSESAGSMPGPADGGEGFNAARSDASDVVGYHGGVVTADDGLASSVLAQSHRFDNPVMVVTITRL